MGTECPCGPFHGDTDPTTPQKLRSTPPSSRDLGPQSLGNVCCLPAPNHLWLSWLRSPLWWTSRAPQLQLGGLAEPLLATAVSFKV